MDPHKKLLSILHIVYGVGAILIFLILNTVFSTFFPFIVSEIHESEGPHGAALFEMVSGIIRTVIYFILLFIPIPSIIGGIAFLNNKSWGLVLMMISGCLSLLSFPLGTALGIYTIWIFLNYRNQVNVNDANPQ